MSTAYRARRVALEELLEITRNNMAGCGTMHTQS
jgi:hypothetical protein